MNYIIISTGIFCYFHYRIKGNILDKHKEKTGVPLPNFWVSERVQDPHLHNALFYKNTRLPKDLLRSLSLSIFT